MANLVNARTRVCGLALAVAVGLTACSPAYVAPSPSQTPTFAVPVPEPTITVDANGRALPGFVTVSNELPGAQPLNSTAFADAGPGWVLTTFRPSVADVVTIDGASGGHVAKVQVVYLVDPEGRRYQVLELDPATALVIDSWTPRETVAYVRACQGFDCAAAPTQVLDLTTGELSPSPMGASMVVGATLPGSVRWWQDGTSAALESNGTVTPFGRAWAASSASPSGRYLAVTRTDNYSAQTSAGLALVDTATGDITDVAMLWPEPIEGCLVFRWRPDDTVDIACEDPARGATRVFAIGPGADEAKENKTASPAVPDEGPWVSPDVVLAEGVWAGVYTPDAQARSNTLHPQVGVARNGGFERLAVPDDMAWSARIVAVRDGSLYIEAEANRDRAPGLTTAWRYSLEEQRWYPLVPLPPGGPTRGLVAAEGAPAWGMTSWVVAP